MVGFNEDFVINEGALTGYTYDLNKPALITTLKVPGSYDTGVSGISNGTAVGTYSLNGVNHGFIAVVVVPGDLNNDGKVDATDYAIWRKGGGTAANYDLWRAHYGQSITGSGSSIESASVPEPSTLLLLGIGAISLLGYRKAKSHG